MAKSIKKGDLQEKVSLVVKSYIESRFHIDEKPLTGLKIGEKDRCKADAKAVFSALYVYPSDVLDKEVASSYFYEIIEKMRCSFLSENILSGTSNNLNKYWKRFFKRKTNQFADAYEQEIAFLFSKLLFSKKNPRKKLTEVQKILYERLNKTKKFISNKKAVIDLINEIMELNPFRESAPQKSEDSLKDKKKSDQKKDKKIPEKKQSADAQFKNYIDKIKSESKKNSQVNQQKHADSLGKIIQQRYNDECDISEDYAYKIFTRQFDEIIYPIEDSSYKELNFLRKELDNELVPFQKIILPFAKKLQKKLFANIEKLEFTDVEEGVLDSKRLSRLVTNPYTNNLFINKLNKSYKDTVITLLIDNSGSMRGRPIVIAALCTDILARVLEKCGVKVEILGFTTKSWKGGESRRLWLKEGGTPNPGRLSDLRHIIYKSANMPWRKAFKNFGYMLKEGVLKENIDGEALIWAAERLKQRAEKRKILIVISDGAPVDDSTLSANHLNILEHHLKNIVKKVENKSKIELMAIGIGHDVSRYYDKSVCIQNIDQLASTIVDKIIKLFSK